MSNRLETLIESLATRLGLLVDWSTLEVDFKEREVLADLRDAHLVVPPVTRVDRPSLSWAA